MVKRLQAVYGIENRYWKNDPNWADKGLFNLGSYYTFFGYFGWPGRVYGMAMIGYCHNSLNNESFVHPK